ncbi:MAG: hypothetical protein U1A78_25910 [Polyangia bacterium]
MSKPPEQVRATRGVYDSELSVTGLGLRADVEKVLGAKSAEVVAALLARADVSTSGALVHYIRQTERGGYEKNFSIRSSPAVKVAVPGSCIRYSAYQDSALSSAGSYTTFQWLCLNDPEASQVYGMPALVRGPGTADWEATWAFPGNHRILCRVQTYLREEGGGFNQAAPQYIEFQQTVHEQGDVLARALDKQRLHAAPERQLQALLMYQQALRTAEQRAGSAKRSPKDAAALNSQIEKLRERLRSSEGRSRYPLKAAHVEAASAKVNPLNVFLARTAQSSGSETWSLVDITNPTDRRLTGEYTGHGKDSKQAIQSALAAWDRGNRYPKGRLRVQVPQETGAPSDTEFQTDGASFWDSVAEFFSQVGFWAGLGMLGAAVAMTVAPDPTVSKAAAVLLWRSILAGTTGTSISMIQRHAQGMSTAGENAMDALTLASNLLGGRWALGATVKGLSLAGSRMGTAVVIGRIGTDTAQGILLAAESVKEYQQILADPDPKQRTDRLVQFLGHLALNGGLLTLSMHGNRADLQKLGAQRACLAKLGHTGEVVSAEGAAAQHAEDGVHAAAGPATKPVPVAEPAIATSSSKYAAESKALADTLPGTQSHKASSAEGGVGKTTSQGKPRVVDPVPGLFDAVDTTENVAPPGWTFHDSMEPVSAGLRIRTAVVAPDRTEGSMVRIYNPRTRELIMYSAFLDELPNKIDAGVPLVPGSGTPTVTYLTLRQLKMAGGQFGQLQSVKMSTIQNIESLLLFHHLRSQGVSPWEAVRQTHSVQYAMTSIQQAGHTVLDIEIDLTGPRVRKERIGWLMSAQENSASTEALRSAKVRKHEELLAKYGMKRSDEVVIDYDIYFELAPHPKNPR